MYDDGLSLFNQKRFDEAIENFLQDTEHKDRFLQIANCYLCKKEYKMALKYINESIKTNPKDVNNCLIYNIILYESDIFFKSLFILCKFQSMKKKTIFEKIIRVLYFSILPFSWLLINYVIYQLIINIGLIDKILYYFVFMQIFVLFSFVFYKWKHFEKIIFFSAMFTALAVVTYPIHQVISWLPLLFQALCLSLLGFAGLIRRDVQYQLLNINIPKNIEKYTLVENYETALNLCNIFIDFAPKDTDLTAYNEFKQKIEEKISK